ncbi:HK97 family phage prohead protease [uncultured Bacteroides sp.]|uniref:HK97 family phage prohead protease n=1 Tax=uncultured Bacteroides sp. TaxID=162156 RepID=UPI0020683264|nr:HK97 family phage prohead protease [uncultured Bacteroides sp.]DAI55628.1 MAG TPA: prohead serine protease [Caudoviricetes sp.]
MAKEVIISTSGLNCYGGRVLTSGIDLTQFQKNPLLLWMHRRSFDRDAMPIGRIDNLRTDGDRLIGTPVFDQNDEFAKKIESKWENGFLRMASAGIEIIETSDAPEHLLQGQTRRTITRCRLEEVSIVDMGGNDEALQLYDRSGKVLKLAAGEDNDALPLLAPEKKDDPSGTAPDGKDNNQTNKSTQSMNKEILQLLGLSETATEQEAVGALRLLKEKADKVETLQLASITAVVDGAIAEKRITADKKEHFVNIGKAAGIDSLRTTLSLMQPVRKPTEVIHQTDTPRDDEPKTYAKLSDVPADQMEKLREERPQDYERLYKAEYGHDIPKK